MVRFWQRLDSVHILFGKLRLNLLRLLRHGVSQFLHVCLADWLDTEDSRHLVGHHPAIYITSRKDIIQ